MFVYFKRYEYIYIIEKKTEFYIFTAYSSMNNLSPGACVGHPHIQNHHLLHFKESGHISMHAV